MPPPLALSNPFAALVHDEDGAVIEVMPPAPVGGAKHKALIAAEVVEEAVATDKEVVSMALEHWPLSPIPFDPPDWGGYSISLDSYLHMHLLAECGRLQLKILPEASRKALAAKLTQHRSKLYK
eukprot:evm.model.scf_2000.2 EVM.evm.TU.scf_2000.2   scf_2000:17570-17938(-)